jgi:hypothetical protein
MPKIRDIRKLFEFALRQPAIRVKYELESQYLKSWDIVGKLQGFQVERHLDYPFSFSIGLTFEQQGIFWAHYLVDFSPYWNGLIGESDLDVLVRLHIIEPSKPLFWSNWYNRPSLFPQSITSREMMKFLKRHEFN